MIPVEERSHILKFYNIFNIIKYQLPLLRVILEQSSTLYEHSNKNISLT